jgi:predicted esterase YcpF (UPF0227 family)
MQEDEEGKNDDFISNARWDEVMDSLDMLKDTYKKIEEGSEDSYYTMKSYIQRIREFLDEVENTI